MRSDLPARTRAVIPAGRGRGAALRRPVLAAVLAAGCGAAAVVGSPCPVRSVPESYDFGEAPPGLLYARFVITNEGPDVVRLGPVSSGCSACVRHRLDRPVLGAGTGTALQVWMDTAGKEGLVEEAIRVRVSGAGEGELTIPLRAGVIPRFSVVPPVLRLTASGTGDTVRATVEIRPWVELAGELNRVVCTNRELKVGLAAARGQGGVIMEVATAPPMGEGLSETVLAVCSSEASDPTCAVRVVLYVVPELEVLPTRLEFDPADEEQTRLVFVRYHGYGPYRLADAVLPGEEFRGMVTEESPGRYRIELRARGLAQRRGWAGELLLKADDGTEKRVPVRVR